MFLHSPEAVVIDLVVVEIVDIDGVALVIRLVAVEKVIPVGRVAWEALGTKRRNNEGDGECVGNVNGTTWGQKLSHIMFEPHRTIGSSRSGQIRLSATRKYRSA